MVVRTLNVLGGWYMWLSCPEIVNAAVGPPVMASPSLLSAQWFPDHERNRATAAAILANNFGAAIGFVLPGWLNVRLPGGE
jgi:MFS family permease